MNKKLKQFSVSNGFFFLITLLPVPSKLSLSPPFSLSIYTYILVLGEMGSMTNPNSWAPYDAYRDSSHKICSIYCPQWCYMIFSPPPPPEGYSAATLSPLIIALIGILASAFLLISYYAVISKYCKRRDEQNPSHGEELTAERTGRDQWRTGPLGLDEVMIKNIAVCKYRKGDVSVEGTECAVCLSEFAEDESIRLLPNCSHAFHLPCIDAWLRSHSNCPLCRSTAVYSGATPSLPPSSQASSADNVSTVEPRRRDDVVLVVDDPEMGGQEEAIAVAGGGIRQLILKNVSEDQAGTNSEHHDDVGGHQLRRSISLGAFSSRRQLLVADILQMGEEDNGDGQRIVDRGENSKRHGGAGGGGAGIKRSVSTGRAMLMKEHHDDKGKISIVIPT